MPPASTLLTSEVLQFGSYRTLAVLDRGDLGVEYLASKIDGGKSPALVRLLALGVLAAAPKKRLKRRIEEARRVAHPHLERVLDVVDDRQALVAVTERISGVTLAELLQRSSGAVEPGTLAAVVLQIATGLQALHDHADRRARPLEWVHGRISPRTIMLSFDGRAVLSDVGLGPLVSAKNDFEYFSPERARSGPVDRTSDVFALGLVLYECLTGTRPFSHRSLPDHMLSVLADQVKDPCALRPELTPELCRITLRCLEREPERRFAAAGEVAEALRACPGVDTVTSEERLSTLLAEHFAHEREAERRLVESAESRVVSLRRSPPPGRACRRAAFRPVFLLLMLAIALLIAAWAALRGA